MSEDKYREEDFRLIIGYRKTPWWKVLIWVTLYSAFLAALVFGARELGKIIGTVS